MKRRIKLWAAYMMILCMCTAIILPNKIAPVSAAEKEGELLISDFEIVKVMDYSEDIPLLGNNVDVRDGDKLAVSFKWRLPDDDSSSKVFAADLSHSYRNLEFADGQQIKLLHDKDEVGELTFRDGRIIAEFTDNNYLSDTDRNGGASLEAIVFINEGAKADGQKRIISIKNDNFPVTYRSDNSGSGIWLNKYPDGSVKKNGDKYTQKFTVTLQTYGGKVSDIVLTDEMGGASVSNNNIIVEGFTNIPGIAEGASMPFSELADKLHSSPLEDAWIKFSYNVDVDGNIYAQDTSIYTDEYKNTITANYTSSTGALKSEVKSAYIQVKKPSVVKNGVIRTDNDGKPTGTIGWSVIIELNDMTGEAVISENMISDTMLGLQTDPNKKFIPKTNADGKITGYELTYETAIPAADPESITGKRYHNKASVEICGNIYTAECDAVLPAKSWINKTFEGYDADGKLSWKIDIGPVPSGVTDVVLTEAPVCQDMGWHEIVQGSIELAGADGTRVKLEQHDASKSQDAWLDNWDGSKVRFSPDYIDRVARSDEKTITLYVKTEIKESSAGGKTYRNSAALDYTYNSTPVTITDYADYSIDTKIFKSGQQDSSHTKINYAIRIDLDKFSLIEGTDIVITDMIPDGLTLYLSSCRVTGQVKWSKWDIRPDPGFVLDMPITPAVAGQKADFTIPVTAELINRINEAKEVPWIKKDGGSPIIYLTYTAGVSDLDKYLSEGIGVTYTNTAVGKYGQEELGSGTSSVTMEPNKFVKKKYTYNAKTAPNINYTIEVNPDRLELAEGGKLVLTDRLGPALVYCLDTVEVCRREEGGGLTPLEFGRDYVYAYSQENNSLVFTLPDSESLVVAYEAYVNRDFGGSGPGSELTADDAFNEASLSGYSNSQSSDRTHYSGAAIKPLGWADSKLKKVSVNKIYKSNGVTVMLPGCEFKLVEYGLENGKLIEKRTVKEGIITDKDGTAEIDKIEQGKIYGIVETGVPEGGFHIKDGPLYFMIGSGEAVPHEYSVVSINEGGLIYFENDPPEGQEESGEPSGSGEDTKPSETGTNDRNGDVEGEQNNHNKPSKPAEGEEPEGGEDPNGRNPDLEGDGSLVGTSDGSYIKILLAFLILSVIAAAGTEITILCFEKEK